MFFLDRMAVVGSNNSSEKTEECTMINVNGVMTIIDENKNNAEELKEKANDFFKSNDFLFLFLKFFVD